jgi:uncharacterized phage protein (TIGR02216 family)
MRRLTVGALMALGLGQLKLDPGVFWRMTLPELRAAAGGPMQMPAGLRRSELEALIRQYPDDDDGGGR